MLVLLWWSSTAKRTRKRYDALVERGVTVVVSTVEHPAEVPALLRERKAVGRAEDGERLAKATEAASPGSPQPVHTAHAWPR